MKVSGLELIKLNYAISRFKLLFLKKCEGQIICESFFVVGVFCVVKLTLCLKYLIFNLEFV